MTVYSRSRPRWRVCIIHPFLSRNFQGGSGCVISSTALDGLSLCKSSLRTEEPSRTDLLCVTYFCWKPPVHTKERRRQHSRTVLFVTPVLKLEDYLHITFPGTCKKTKFQEFYSCTSPTTLWNSPGWRVFVSLQWTTRHSLERLNPYTNPLCVRKTVPDSDPPTT